MVAVGGMGAGTEPYDKPKEPEPEVNPKNEDGSNKTPVEIAKELEDIADAKQNQRMIASQIVANGNADRAAESADQNSKRLADSRRESDTIIANGKIAANEVSAASQAMMQMVNGT